MAAGIREIVALVLLKRLQTALGSDVGDYFEYIAGTSAGTI
jgi:patatin-like phospholipase/acyl hydrolase